MSVIVIGAGPAGLACALELRRRGIPDVLVLDREQRAGGIPRHCAHQGFGVRDMHRVLSGPRYAQRAVGLARQAGAEIRSEAMVTGWSADGELEVTTPDGRESLGADAIVLATGCRERPRPARLVPGSRPEGVLTTGMLQQLAKTSIGTRALVIGAEHVSFSALLTLAHAGVQVVGMVTDLPRHQSLALVRAGTVLRYRTPLWTRTAVTAIHGRARVEEVDLLELDTGRTRHIACDTVVFTGDWIPDHELVVLAGIELDPGTRGPRVDTGLRTGRTGVFAAGNLVQGAEPADVAALSGRHAAASAWSWLSDSGVWSDQVSIHCAPPLQWISPNAVSLQLTPPPRGRFALRATTFLRKPFLEIKQDDRVLWSGNLARLGPGRSNSLSSSWIAQVEAEGSPIDVAVRH